MAIIWETTDRLGRIVILTDEGWAHNLPRRPLWTPQRTLSSAASGQAADPSRGQFSTKSTFALVRRSDHGIQVRTEGEIRDNPMALIRTQTTDQRWRTPVWPTKLPAAESLHAVYGPEADELTIRFPETSNRDIVVVWLATPEIEYAALMVHEYTGEIVGVQVGYLANYAVLIHPHWKAALEPGSRFDVVKTIVSDAKRLHDQFGTD